MAIVNENFLKLPGSYLFSDIAKKVNAFKAAHPEARLIRLGIGDVTRPLPPACIEAMHRAVDELAHAETFRGYGPEQGYDFLIEAIIANDFAPRGVQLKPSEVFVSDGAKSDTGNIGDILQGCNSVAVTDPVYPVYIDSNVMSGRAGDLQEDGRWSRITYLPCTAENGFIPQIPDTRMDMVYLCYPNNPTGTTLTKEQLKQWVDYALANDSLILFDAAYEAFIREDDVPHSIYEIEGAKQCAIEFRSFSKTAGFTGVRCGYTVVPEEVMARTADGERVSLNKLWNRRQCTKSSPVHQVQRYKLRHPACGRSHLQSGRKETSQGNHRLLPGECPHHARRFHPGRFPGIRWCKLSVPVAEDSRRLHFLAVLRPSAERCACSRYAGRRFRSERRRLLASYCLR